MPTTAQQAARGASIGERLVAAGLVTRGQVETALRVQARSGERLGSVLVGLGFVAEGDVLRILCAAEGVPFIPAEELRAEATVPPLIPEAVARAHHALPVRREGRALLVAFADPFDLVAVRAVEQASGMSVKPVGAPREAIGHLLQELFADGGPSTASWMPAPSQASLIAADQEAAARPDPTTLDPEMGTAARVVESIIRTGLQLGATDIHVEPFEDAVRIRYRVDGILQTGTSLPKRAQAALLSRIKILASLDIAEMRLPQDGRVRIQAEGRMIDLRVSTFPTVHGEDVVLRILDRGRVALELAKLGIHADDLEVLRTALRRPHGLIPVTGPTGSGKTTTLYSALLEMNTGRGCILTLEDPVEYEVEGIRQSQINVRAGLTFASGLRSMLRHDPDTILVGEMRDPETVQIALSAALTGHMVLTTLHTTSAAGAVPRLLEMGAEPYVVASAISLIVSQRLVRVLCPDCKRPAPLPPEVARRFGLQDVVVYAAVGCPRCRNVGFRGRLGIFEFLPLTDEMLAAVYARRTADEIRAMSDRPTLLDDGVRKVRAGLTTIDEVLRVAV
ncbi:MAG: GspE/PulE family protein [Gemmatimonadaceae bacterium]